MEEHSNNAFTTTNRKLEQFLYMHGIRFDHWTKDLDGITIWVYENTPETMRVVEEFRDINARKAVRKYA